MHPPRIFVFPRENRLATTDVRHPRLSTPIGIRISRLGIFGIVFVYLGGVIFLALAAALVFAASDQGLSWPSLRNSLRTTLSLAIGTGDAQDVEGSPIKVVIAYVLSILGVLLPAVLLGAFVYLLLHFDPIVWKKSISLSVDSNGRPLLAIRFYNGSSQLLTDMRAVVTVRHITKHRPATIFSENARLRRGDDFSEEGRTWPTSGPGMVQTVFVPLIGNLDNPSFYFRSMGTEIALARLDFVVSVDGTIGATHSSFKAQKFYTSADVRQGEYGEVDVDPSVKARKWRGWENFDDDVQMFVFGYGSLLLRSSAEMTVGEGEARYHAGRLRGYRLEWNAGLVDPVAAATAFEYEDSGRPFAGALVALGVNHVTDSICLGVAIPVTRHQLAALDAREANYERIDVTADFEFDSTEGMESKNAVVLTYLPKADAVAAARDVSRSRISNSYLEIVRAGYEERGIPADQVDAAIDRSGLSVVRVRKIDGT